MTYKDLDKLPKKILRVDFLTVFALFILVILVSHCDSSGNGPDPEMELVCTIGPESGTILPLRVGNSWDYYFHNADSPVSDSARWAVAKRFPEIPIEGDSSLFGIHWYSLDMAPPDGVTLYEVKEAGLYQRGVIATEDSIIVDVLLYPYPAQLGAKGLRLDYGWDVDHYVVDDTAEVELMEKDAVLETPAGTFSAYVYRWFSPPPPDVGLGRWIYDYYAPGYGFIAREFRRQLSLDIVGSWKLKRLCILQYRPVTE